MMQVSPKEIPSPKNSPLPHNAYILHNLAHIELNAIDLAWDTVVRFASASEVLGSQFFSDFAHVADDESRHFGWCLQRLAELGFRYDMSNSDLPRRDKNPDVNKDKVGSSQLTNFNPHDIPTSHEVSKTTDSDLSEVCERLTCIIAMEKENSE